MVQRCWVEWWRAEYENLGLVVGTFHRRKYSEVGTAALGSMERAI